MLRKNKIEFLASLKNYFPLANKSRNPVKLCVGKSRERIYYNESINH